MFPTFWDVLFPFRKDLGPLGFRRERPVGLASMFNMPYEPGREAFVVGLQFFLGLGFRVLWVSRIGIP